MCFLSLSLLLPKMCFFHILDSSLCVKALLDLLCKRTTSLNSCYYFRIDLLYLPRGFVNNSVKTVLHVHTLYWKEGIDLLPELWAENSPKKHAVCGSIPAAVGDRWYGPCHMSFREMCWQNWVIPSGSLWGASHPNCLHTLWKAGAPEVSPTQARWGTLPAPLCTSQGNWIPGEAYQCGTDMPTNTWSHRRHAFKIGGWWWLIKIHSCFYSIS